MLKNIVPSYNTCSVIGCNQDKEYSIELNKYEPSSYILSTDYAEENGKTVNLCVVHGKLLEKYLNKLFLEWQV